MTMGPEPMIRIFLMSVLLDIVSEAKDEKGRGLIMERNLISIQAVLDDPVHGVSHFRRSPFGPSFHMLQHDGFELFKKIAGVVRAGRRFRVVLYAERWK